MLGIGARTADIGRAKIVSSFLKQEVPRISGKIYFDANVHRLAKLHNPNASP